MSSSLSPCLSQRFGRCTLRSSGGRNVELNPLFRLPELTFLVPRAMFNGYQLSPVNFPSENSPLPSPGIELTLFGYVTGSKQRLYPQCHVSLRTSLYEFLFPSLLNLVIIFITTPRMMSDIALSSSKYPSLLFSSLYLSSPALPYMKTRSVLGMTLNCIWCWESVEYGVLFHYNYFLG